MSRRIPVFFILFCFLGAASRPATAQNNILYFNYPNGTSLPIGWEGGNAIPVAADTRITVKRVIKNRDGSAFYEANVEFTDASGKRRTARDVMIPDSDTRAGAVAAPKAAPAAAPEPPCPPQGPGNINRLSNEIPNKNAPIDAVYNYFQMGDCLKDETGGKGDLFYGTMLKKCGRIERGAGDRPLARHVGKAVTAKDACAIEAMARTLYGEMRGCHKHGLYYPMAVAKVMWNRATKVSQSGFVDTFVSKASKGVQERLGGDPKGRAPAEIVPHLFESPKQFSCWNRGDPNNQAVLCPDRKSPEWVASFDIATAVVMNDQDYMTRTTQVQQKHYTSQITPNWRGAREVNGVQVTDTPLDVKKCLRLWDFPRQ